MVSDVITDDREKIAVLNLLALDGIGSGTVIRLVEQLHSAQAVFDASEAELRSVPKLSSTAIERLQSIRADSEVGAKQFDEAAKAGIEVRTYWDENYPPGLRQIEGDAPAVLFIRGHLPAEAKRLAVVGTRSATAYGKRMVHDLVVGLRGSGLHIISGLASGIDGYAHEAALEAGLITEAVFGCGVERVYPPMNTGLANRILASGGALISEYPVGTAPDRFHFPARNRIIAGLALGTMVVEAGDKSGALITSALALDYNRDVMAVPGAVTNPKSRGCHDLIKHGAALVETAEDILEALEMRFKGRKSELTEQMALSLSPPETAIVQVLDATEALHIDDLALRLKVTVGEVLGQLLLLELKGIVKQLPGKYFVRA
jgi:DNA processing protein